MQPGRGWARALPEEMHCLPGLMDLSEACDLLRAAHSEVYCEAICLQPGRGWVRASPEGVHCLTDLLDLWNDPFMLPVTILQMAQA